MDQLRTALVWLKRHHFWVLCGLVALIALGSWAKASGKLTALFTKNQSDIKAEFGNVNKLREDPFHPNEDVNTKQQAADRKQQAADVAKALAAALRPPARARAGVAVGAEQRFRDYVDKLQFGAEIRDDLRNHYQNYIENHFPSLPKRIDARAVDPRRGSWRRSRRRVRRGQGFAEEPGGAGQELLDDNDYICEWSPTDQASIRDDLNFREQPSSLKIWVTQENLWVYHTLLDVIAKTNKAANATRMSNAAVQQIGELAVGMRAATGSHTSGRLVVKPAVGSSSWRARRAGRPGAAPGTVSVQKAVPVRGRPNSPPVAVVPTAGR